MLLLLLITKCMAEIFEFRKPGEKLELRFRLNPSNINKGFFKPYPNSNLTYDINIASVDKEKIFYSMNLLKENEESHFSFSNTDPIDVNLTFISRLINESVSSGLGRIQMKFDSSIDTFDKEVARKKQIEPAIYAIEHLYKKVEEVIDSSKIATKKVRTLGTENRNMMMFVIGFSFLTFIGYAIFNGAQLYFMKSYLNTKKYL